MEYGTIKSSIVRISPLYQALSKISASGFRSEQLRKFCNQNSKRRSSSNKKSFLMFDEHVLQHVGRIRWSRHELLVSLLTNFSNNNQLKEELKSLLMNNCILHFYVANDLLYQYKQGSKFYTFCEERSAFEKYGFIMYLLIKFQF